MSEKIKYKGRIYVAESSLDGEIKDRVEEKVNSALEDVLGENEPEKSVEAPNLEETSEEPSLDTPDASDNGEDIKIEGAIEAIKNALGISEIPEDDLNQLQLVLGSILSGSAATTPSDVAVDVPPEAPDTILHEGRIFKKVGKLSDIKSLTESVQKPTPKKISVGGVKYILCESK